ncbi:hypothetical protein VL20_2803 [Microcystis panniformis FACHB-1757]|uniref:Uncharacterized protein n=1 Tax=Microcystis panniformis FACHB-1757 TaxID=1638788 RepID=A0A0K1S1C1_9CHRO|nr:hypothetical protein VL20_2803 [Microcystis panniformis FACHB-1757]
MRQRLLGYNHPDVATSLNNLVHLSLLSRQILRSRTALSRSD